MLFLLWYPFLSEALNSGSQSSLQINILKPVKGYLKIHKKYRQINNIF